MSSRNDYDYFDLDNFDDSYSSSDYRRRTQRSGGSYNRRPSGSYDRRPSKRRNKRRTRNRIVIVTAALLILAVLIFVIVTVVNGCSNKSEEALATVSTSTVSKNPSATAKGSGSSNASGTDKELSPDYFVTPKIEDDNTNGEMAYNIYVWHNIGFELFGSDEARAKNYAQTINGFADRFGSKVKVYDMIVPNHTEMGLPQRLKDSDAPSTSQADNIKSAYAALSDKVTPINCYNKLAEHNDEYIYFKSDHHWTALGSYYAYAAFAETNGLPVLSLDDCTENKIDGFTGSFINTVSTLDTDTVSYWDFPYSVTMDISNNGEATTYDSPYYQYAQGGPNTYGAFILGDNALTVLRSESEKAEKGKKIAVVKESYGNAFVPYLTYNYEEVHVVDFRYYNGNLVTYCQENNIDEVLFLNGVMSANTQIQLDSMSSLFN